MGGKKKKMCIYIYISISFCTPAFSRLQILSVCRSSHVPLCIRAPPLYPFLLARIHGFCTAPRDAHTPPLVHTFATCLSYLAALLVIIYHFDRPCLCSCHCTVLPLPRGRLLLFSPASGLASGGGPWGSPKALAGFLVPTYPPYPYNSYLL